MSPLSSAAISGLHAATTHLDVAAHNIANSQTPHFKREVVTQQTQEQSGVLTSVGKADEVGVDLAKELVAQMQATYTFRANLKTIQTEDAMKGSLLDIRA